MSTLHLIWNWQIQVAPVLLAVLLVELPAYIQRRARIAYVPIYFAVFPLGELNKDLSVYLGEDYWLGRSVEDDEADEIRKRIIFKSMLSMALAAIVIPLFAGFVSAFFLIGNTLTQFVIVALGLKGYRIAKAVRDFPQHANGTVRNRLLLTGIYLLYLGVFAQMIVTAHKWTRPFVESGDWAALISNLSNLIFTKVTVQAIILALLSAAFVSLIADKKLRRENLRGRADDLG